ncbi:tigger transposable element-derived protein 1-like [Macrobrachium rosenbergii]|uniref:tigger transposable element-derived protein 1-like n=1 Tax=Macrobrachium rosenbergii TaxID=79674 RepID=UPI0034D6DAAE
MAPKQQNASSDASALKKKGEMNTKIGRALGLSRTMVMTIVKDKKCILQLFEDAAPMQATVIDVKQHSQNLVEMEKLLLVWLEDQNQRVPVSLSVIQEKARELHEAAVKKNGEGSANGDFVTRRGWFNRFKARANLHSLKFQGEAASADSEAMDSFPGGLAETIREGCNIADAVRNIARAWEEVKKMTLNGSWKKMCLQFVNSFEGFEEAEEVETVTRKIVALSKKLQLDMEAEDVTELLASHGEEMSLEDFTELEKQMIKEESDTPDPKPRLLSTKGLSESFPHSEKALACFEAGDPNMIRFAKVQRGIMDCVTVYKETLKEKS